MIKLFKLGDITVQEAQMLPSFSYVETARKVAHARRSANGTLRTQRLYQKYQTIINGVSIDHFPGLEREYEKDANVDLSSIKRRMELFAGDAATLIFYITRQTRVDTNYKAVVEYPIGTVLTEGVDYTVANVTNGGVLKGEITFTNPPATGTDNIAISYYPILSVYVTQCNLTWNEWEGQTGWQIVCEEA